MKRRQQPLMIPGFSSAYHARLGEQIKHERKEAEARSKTASARDVTRSEYFRGRPKRVSKAEKRKATEDFWEAVLKNPRLRLLGKYQCKRCGAQYKTARAVIEHLNEKHGGEYRLHAAPRKNPQEEPMAKRHKRSTPAFERLRGEIYREERRKHPGYSAGRLDYIADAAAGQVAVAKHRRGNPELLGGDDWKWAAGSAAAVVLGLFGVSAAIKHVAERSGIRATTTVYDAYGNLLAVDVNGHEVSTTEQNRFLNRNPGWPRTPGGDYGDISGNLGMQPGGNGCGCGGAQGVDRSSWASQAAASQLALYYGDWPQGPKALSTDPEPSATSAVNDKPDKYLPYSDYGL